MKTGNLETNGGLSPIAGAAGTGLPNAGSGAGGPRPQPSGPGAAQTPQEALTYIDRLYKTGRTDELAAILRRSEVFREAWLLLQQRSFATPAGVSEEPDPKKSAGAFEPEQVPVALTPPQPIHGPGAGGKFACTPAQAHEVYLGHLNFFDQERNSPYRLSLRV